MDTRIILKALNAALQEDLNEKGDITSRAILHDEQVKFAINAKESMILCGIPVLQVLFKIYEKDINYTIYKTDGASLCTGDTIAVGEALASTLFSIERIALNFIQHLSGISSLANQFVQKIIGTKTIIRDTRKTTPGLRLLEKYAVSIGGGNSYRKSLSDAILIKDNHIASCGLSTAIQRVSQRLPDYFIAVECDNIEQVKEAASQTVGLILLDNMSIKEMKSAVELVSNKTIQLEASGGITLDNVAEVATTGVDYISSGAITHSALNKDISLDVLYSLKKDSLL